MILPSRAPTGQTQLWAIGFGVLCAAYLIQTVTPLRIDDDAVDYLRMAAAMTDGRHVPPVPVPKGFSVVLSVLDSAGLGSSFFFVLANCLFLALGLFAVWRLLADYPASVRQATLLFTLLAIPVVKSVAIALPEAAYFGVSLTALWAMTSAADAPPSKQGWLLASSLVCVAAAISIRAIGTAMLPALAWVCLSIVNSRGKDKQKSRTTSWVIAISVLSLALLVLVWNTATFSVYRRWLHDYYSGGNIIGQMAWRVVVMLWACGEVVLNLPLSRFKDLWLVFVAAGIVSLVVVVVAFRKVRTPLSAARIYLVTYIVILAVWPGPSPRLWMPIIPLLIAEVGLVVTQLPPEPWKARLVGAYAGWFALTGIAALAYTTRISLSGADFPNVYGRNGGMPTVEVDSTHPSWGHIQYYKREAQKVITRYGGAERR